MTMPLMLEIKERMAEIEENKRLLGKDYQDFGLLICQPNGRPYEPKAFNKKLKEWESRLGISDDEKIVFQGLRKSGQMHKVRITENNYQLVADNAGQSPKVLMEHYNETRDNEKKELAFCIERDFYPAQKPVDKPTERNTDMIVELIQKNPDLINKLSQLLPLLTTKVG